MTPTTMVLALALALPLHSESAAVSNDTMYTRFAKSDCGQMDVHPQPSCTTRARNLTVAELEACCDSTRGCGGFNTDGVIKTTACAEHVHPQPLCDLYLRRACNAFTTKPSCPSPRCSWMPAASGGGGSCARTPPPPPPPPPPATPWPLPKDAHMSAGDSTVLLSHDFAISREGAPPCATLDAAVERYQKQAVGLHIARPQTGDAGPALQKLLVQVADLDESYPQLNSSAAHEAYQLVIPADGSPATVTADTIWGAMWGMESFSQLVRFDFATQAYSIAGAPWHLHDSPRFPHRGLMIDLSRHFQPLAAIRAIIDSLAYAKLNVLHMHMSDEQSFPMESKTYPKLWDAAFSDQERYTQADLASVVEYARLRGVRCMIEFDVPGHAQAMCKGYPEVCTTCTAQKGSTLPLNPSRNATFQLMESLLTEVTGGSASTVGAPKGLFPGNMVHLGGDEVDTDCFNRDPEIARWMAERGMNSTDAYAYFTQRVGAMAKVAGRRVVQWAEVFGNVGKELDKSSIVHIWRSRHIGRTPSFNRFISPAEVVAAGYQTLINIGYDPTSWYLDNLKNDWKSFYASESIRLDRTCVGFLLFYRACLVILVSAVVVADEPCLNISDADCTQYVLGGEGEMVRPE